MSFDTSPPPTPPADDFLFDTPSPAPAGSLFQSADLPDGGTTSSSHSAGKKKEEKTTVDVDPDFYLESLFVVFQVEHCLFRVPAYLLAKESQWFVKKFGVPQSPTDNGKGSSSKDPIVMDPEYKREDFRNLLKALYPRSVSLQLSLSKAEWTSVLKLSTKWQFINLRKMAISELEDMPAFTDIDRITLGRQNSIPSWVISGLEGIAQRDATITDDEVIDMDYMTAVKLFRVRELRLKGMLPYGLRKKVEEVFDEEMFSFKLDEDPAFKADEDTTFKSSESLFLPPGPVGWGSLDSVDDFDSGGWGMPADTLARPVFGSSVGLPLTEGGGKKKKKR